MKPWMIAAVSALLTLAAVFLMLAPIPGDRPRPELTFAARTDDLGAIALPERPEGTVDINSDDPLELAVLPGIGETMALRIIDERLLNGPYYFPEDLLTVRGIGEATLDRFRDMLDFSGPDE